MTSEIIYYNILISYLDERLQQVLGQELRVAPQDQLPQLLVRDVLERAAQQDREVLRRLELELKCLVDFS